MSDEPVNKLYGNKVKLDFTKLGKKSEKEESTTVDVKKEQEKVISQSEPQVEEVAVEEVAEEVVDEPVEEVEEIKEVVEEPKSTNNDSDVLRLKEELKSKESKLKNQSNELNYLTNTIIPDLKKENSKLKSLKVELTSALDKTSRKYYDQLDINEDLSNRIGELGADSAVNKARTDRLESELETIKDEYEGKIASLKEKINKLQDSDVDEFKNTNQKLTNELKDSNEELEDYKQQNDALKSEVDDLRKKLIEMGDYKEEVDENAKKSIDKLKDEIVTLKADLKLKQSNYDKLSNDSQKTISDLRGQINKLKEDAENQSSKGGFLNRFK